MQTTDPREDRAVRALRDLLTDLPTVPLAPEPRLEQTRRRSTGALLVAAVVTLLLILLQTVGQVADPSPAGGEEPGVLPDPFPAYSHLASTVEDDPAGAAMMVFTHGSGTELLDSPKAVALGADGATYRSLRTADRAGARVDQGDPGPTLVSPDGLTVAVGSRGGTGTLTTVDLRSGLRSEVALGEGRSTVPLAWSTDSRLLYVGTVTGQIDRYASLSGTPPRPDYDVSLVDLDAPPEAATRDLPALAGADAVAALPDAAGLLVARDGHTELHNADATRLLREDTGVPPGLQATSVSPDGRRAVVESPGRSGRFAVVDLDDGVAGTDRSHDLSDLGSAPEVLGWLGDDRLLVAAYDDATSASRLHLFALPVTGEAEELLVAQPGWTGAGIFDISVAADRLVGAEVADVGRSDRGSDLVLLRIGMVLALAVCLVLGLRLVAARLRRDR
ncbi:hypothetical protein [Serinicoccus kebangsaanensis]|uniref:hypothetical protein n=1 Tax=Serinicoccus kebangsaanensis TaxID=2602069 RepID=UPI00124DAC88|nr:hypothetical protein [Serinicoccus kebangsaanensis]